MQINISKTFVSISTHPPLHQPPATAAPDTAQNDWQALVGVGEGEQRRLYHCVRACVNAQKIFVCVYHKFTAMS